MITIRPAAALDRARLLTVWLASVRATHDFLTEADIQSLLPVVRDVALPRLEVWLAELPEGVAGFVALTDAHVEALFVDPAFFRRGCGQALIAHARHRKGALTVDVNEQNPSALAFYQSNGFEVEGRSPVDANGNPFPLLHLRESHLSHHP